MHIRPAVPVLRFGWQGVVVLALLTLGGTLFPPAARGEASRGDARRGEPLYRRYCAVCHGATGEGDGPNAAFLDDDRPRDLTDARYMARRTDSELVQVIRGGGGVVALSRFMPAWGNTFSTGQMADLVAYVRTLSRRPHRPVPTAAEPPEAAGKRLVVELGCPGCHRIENLPAGAVAPDLSHAGIKLQRAWLEAYLQRPHRIRPGGYLPLTRSRMPDFRLSAEESRRLAAYLVRGFPVVARPDGNTPIPDGSQGRTLFQGLSCRACHRFEGRGGRAGPDLALASRRLQPGWLVRYLVDPQAVDPRSPMPRPGIDIGEARTLASYLLNGTTGAPPERPVPVNDPEATQGSALFRDLACRGCHRRADEAAPERVGPDLTFIGDKLRPEWMATFLRRPHAVRPWLLSRMPTYSLSDAEVEQITAFLETLRDGTLPPLPPRFRGPESASAELIRAGARMVSRDFLSCSSCHPGGGQPPEGPSEEWAPDLRLAGRRLQPEWIVRWLLDPQRLLPGTKMPSFFADAESGPEEILDGDEERQILALRDYLTTLGTQPADSVP